MRAPSPIRRALRAASAALLLLAPVCLAAQPAGKPVTRPSNSASRPNAATPQQPQHLAQWMENHRNLTLMQQQQALENEPGFRTLRPEVQQRMRNRLTELNHMPPAQRERVLARTEAMEALTPPQRQQFRGAMQQLGALPPERRRVVARTFRDIRQMPPNERQAYMNSEWYRNEFNEQERGTLSNLIAVEPLLPLAPSPVAPPTPLR